MKKVYLVGRSGIHGNKELPVENEIIIGRDAAVCQLVYPSSERGISSVHCKVSNINGTVQITDLGSTNGTFLDTGVRLAPQAGQVLQSGQGFYLADRGNSFAIRIQDDGMGQRPPQGQGYPPQGPQGYPPQGGQGYPPQGPQGYPPQRPGYPPQRPVYQAQGGKKGFSIAGMALGITSLVLIWFPGILSWIGVAAGIVGLVLSGYALAKRFDGRPMAIAGLVCSIITCAFGAIAVVSCICLIGTIGAAMGGMRF